MYKRFFESRIRELWDLYNAIGDVEHRGEKGMLRELVLRKLLVSILPPHFGVGTGVIVDKWQRQSSQIDLIVYDRRFLPPLLNENERGIFPIDIVLRVMEVKSILDKKGIHQTLNTAWQLDPRNPTGLKMAVPGKLDGGQMNYPLVGCFAYASKITNPLACAEEWGAERSNTFVCVADTGVYMGDDFHLLKGGLEQNIRRFFTLFLQFIEAESASRRGFSLVEWLLD